MLTCHMSPTHGWKEGPSLSACLIGTGIGSTGRAGVAHRPAVPPPPNKGTRASEGRAWAKC